MTFLILSLGFPLLVYFWTASRIQRLEHLTVSDLRNSMMRAQEEEELCERVRWVFILASIAEFRVHSKAEDEGQFSGKARARKMKLGGVELEPAMVRLAQRSAFTDSQTQAAAKLAASQFLIQRRMHVSIQVETQKPGVESRSGSVFRRLVSEFVRMVMAHIRG